MSLEEQVAKSSQIFSLSQSEKKNARFQRYMEDAHSIIPCLNDDPNVFYASVFDGHGGRETADFVNTHLPKNLINALSSEEMSSIERCLEYAYYFTDIESKEGDVKNSGCAGVTVLIVNEDDKRVLYSANAGDSRSVLYSAGVTTRLSYDHKASDPNEEKRITDLGGFVMNKRVLGILAVSRSFGDHSYKRFVTARPHISRTELSGDAEFVVIACDGVFDVLLDEDVTQLVKAEAKEGRIGSCAEKIIQEAVARGSTDNITALVIALKPVEQWSCCVYLKTYNNI